MTPDGVEGLLGGGHGDVDIFSAPRSDLSQDLAG